MFLKRLDVLGFKSFAHKTSVEFVPGVTAVVGPNGSGKSNITDAIRWVLGEQSVKSLRGSKMEDIIFSGSDAKKALNVAEVTLTLDNGDKYLPYDYSEISVTRRVFRSGDSEFLLNGQTCRLKDIVDLFLDSGLGREAYSVIGQGKIDEILNSRAEDKRKIFEEAAGVLKYKLRKQTAEKKLAESEEDLNRVEDILHELENQIGPLEEQASIAKDYLAKKEQLENVEVALLAYDIEQTHQRWEQVKKKVEALTEQKETQMQSIGGMEASCRKKQADLTALDRSIEELQDALLLASEQLEKYTGQKDVLRERQKHAKESADELNERIGRLEEKKNENMQTLKAEERRYRAEKKKEQAIRARLKAKLEEYDFYKQDLNDMIEKLKADYIEILNQKASMRNEKRYLAEQMALLKKKSQRLGQSVTEVQEAAQNSAGRRRALQKEVEQKTKESRQIDGQSADLEKQVTGGRDHYRKQSEALDKITRYIGQAESRKEMLEAMSQDYTGFFHGVKTVLQARRSLRGIHGAVAELIRVDREYETAIETALGGAAQHVVVSDEACGREAIQYLRRKQAGRATFLPLSVVKPRRIQPLDAGRINGHPAYVGIAESLVRTGGDYAAIIGHLLGNTVVSKDLKGAGELAKLLGYRYRIVTLEGDVVSPGGAMTGGSQKQKNAGLIGRNREIEQIKAQLKEMQVKKQQLLQAFSALKQTLAADEMTLQDLRKKSGRLAEEKRALDGLLKEAELEEKSSREKYRLLARETDDFASEQQSIKSRIVKIDSQMQSNEKQEKALQQKIAGLADQKKNQEVSKETLQSEITALKVEAAQQGQIVAHQNDKTNQMRAQLEELTLDLESARTAVNKLSTRLDDQKRGKRTLDENIAASARDKENLALWIEERRKLRNEQKALLVFDEDRLKQVRNKQDALAGALQAEKVSLGRLDVQLDHLLAALSKDYEMSFEAAKEKYPLTIAVEEARKQVKLTKRAIAELGTVNLGAIEEYDRVSSRRRFLFEQRSDLLQAKTTLEDVMAEMDEEVKRRFGETFYNVREQFQRVFQELFGGGKADLRLVDPDDLLNSGIDILAEPPGKKLQQLSLLSGGERALTAIALLFAILKVRPVPFCVLDEVEAALDDANVDRYARFLKAFSSETQFIVVTHRKGTMEHADVLYGVTMQESGVSKLVSVRLEETEAFTASR